MTIEEFGIFMLTHSSGRTNVPSGEIMSERIWTAMKRISKNAYPLKLTVNEPAGLTIVRKVDESTYIRQPGKPILGSSKQLDMDDDLMDALAYYVLAGLETQRAKTYMGLYWGEINSFNDTLTETDLNTANNEASRFRKFP